MGGREINTRCVSLECSRRGEGRREVGARGKGNKQNKKGQSYSC